MGFRAQMLDLWEYFLGFGFSHVGCSIVDCVLVLRRGRVGLKVWMTLGERGGGGWWEWIPGL